ncbi:MAG TPA: glycosyltransferase family 4 protein [Thermoanaerobaculia bacterium]
MKPRILITLPFCLSTPGGMTIDCLHLARYLSLAGAEVLLLTVQTQDWDRFPRSRWSEEELGREPAAWLREAGVEVIGLPPHPLHFALDALRVRRALACLLAARRIDVVLGWVHETLFLPSLLRRHQVVNGMVAAASYGPLLEPGSRFLRPLDRLRRNVLFRDPLRRADLVIARSELTRRELMALVPVEPERIQVVHCGVDPSFFAVPREPSPDLRRFIFFGQLCAEKGIFDALEALGRLAARGRRDWTLKVAGWGEAAAVRRTAERLGIAGQVELLGTLGREALRRELAWAQLAILPSRMESFGLANAESQAAGLPVIAYHAAAVPEVVAAGQTGWLLPPGRVDLLAETLEAAVADPAAAFALGLAGRRRMWELFRPERSAALTLEAVAAAVQRRRLAGAPELREAA